MTYAARSLTADRTLGLLFSLAIHLALGLALVAWPDSGPSGARPQQGKDEHVLVVELLPLSSGDVRADSPLAERAAPRSDAGEGERAQLQHAATDTLSRGGGTGDTGRGERSEDGAGTAEASRPATDGAVALSGSEVQLFRSRLLRHIERFRRYPPEARAGGLEGVAQVHFVMDQSGEVKDVWIEMSSGVRLLDDEAIAAILRARPLPAPPAGWPATFGVTLPIGYTLK